MMRIGAELPAACQHSGCGIWPVRAVGTDQRDGCSEERVLLLRPLQVCME